MEHIFDGMKLYEHIINFYANLRIPSGLPEGVEVMNPYENIKVRNYLKSFYSKYYSDNNPRLMLIGINPGRFGGGVTGIPFTDPINLEAACGIKNDLEKRYELSSKFIYHMINAVGGPEKFYGRVFITAASPLGFIKDGKNLNYYDLPELLENWKPFMIKTLKDQLQFCKIRSVCFSLGQGKNFKYLQRWNEVYHLFEDIKPLPHPRWVMQYRLKKMDEFIDMYRRDLSEFLEHK